eukprot:Awhi_evm1s4335
MISEASVSTCSGDNEEELNNKITNERSENSGGKDNEVTELNDSNPVNVNGNSSSSTDAVDLSSSDVEGDELVSTNSNSTGISSRDRLRFQNVGFGIVTAVILSALFSIAILLCIFRCIYVRRKQRKQKKRALKLGPENSDYLDRDEDTDGEVVVSQYDTSVMEVPYKKSSPFSNFTSLFRSSGRGNTSENEYRGNNEEAFSQDNTRNSSSAIDLLSDKNMI